jgi:hypothetical protein
MAMKRFLLALAFLFTVMTWPAQAQDSPSSAEGSPSLANLEIALWPEFDRPEVLVIYRGLFAPETPLPLPVEFRIPADVGQPTAVAYVGEGGQRLNQEHTTRVEDDWLVVSFELPSQGFQLEYYDTLPVDSTGQRQFTYTYTADYPLTALQLELQVPPTAEAFTLEPPADSVVPEADGLTYHLVQAGPLAQGETESWTFSYQKPDSDLTVSTFAQAETPVPAPPPVAGGTDNSSVLIFLLAFVALVGVGAAAFWLGRRTQPISEPAPPPTGQRKRRGSGRGTPTQQQLPPSGREEMFCYKCGTQVRPDADFCHRCGAVVRKI